MKLTAKGDSRKERPSVSVSVPIDGCFAVAWLQHSETSRRNDLILSAAPPPKTWVALSPSRVVGTYSRFPTPPKLFGRAERGNI
jgi:hypothetical protein